MFKVGDKVRVIIPKENNSKEPPLGAMGIIKRVDGEALGENYIFLYIDWNEEYSYLVDGGWFTKRFELVVTRSKQLHFNFN